jgi:hypothetical protein
MSLPGWRFLKPWHQVYQKATVNFNLLSESPHWSNGTVKATHKLKRVTLETSNIQSQELRLCQFRLCQFVHHILRKLSEPKDIEGNQKGHISP